jgi:PAS domain-containing protein
MVDIDNAGGSYGSRELGSPAMAGTVVAWQSIVARFDRELRHTYIDGAIQIYTGRPPSDFIGKSNRDLGMPSELVDDWDRKLHHVFLSGESAVIQFSFETAHGPRTFKTHLTPERDASGKSPR